MISNRLNIELFKTLSPNFVEKELEVKISWTLKNV